MAGPGPFGGGVAGEHEDPGADDAADAEQHQVQRAKRALQLAMVGLGVDHLHRLALKDARKNRWPYDSARHMASSTDSGTPIMAR